MCFVSCGDMMAIVGGGISLLSHVLVKGLGLLNDGPRNLSIVLHYLSLNAYLCGYKFHG